VLLVAFDGRVGLLAVSGMETSLFLLLLAMAFQARLAERPALAGAAAGLSAWARPEGLILLGVFALDGLLGRLGPGRPAGTRLSGLRFGLPAGLLASAFLGFNLALGGTLLPGTFAAKTTYYAVLGRSGFLATGLAATFASGAWLALLPLALARLFAEAWQTLRGRPAPLRREAGWVLALPLAYALLLPFAHRFERYLVPALPAFSVLALAGLRDAARWLARRPLPRAGLAARLLAGSLLLPAGLLQAGSAARGDRDYRFFCAYHQARHERTGHWLAAHTPPDAVVATHDVGAIAYYSRRRVVDLVGVVLPEAVAHLHRPDYTGYLEDLFRRERVTHLAMLRSWGEVVNAAPLFVADPAPEVMEVFAWLPGITHLMPLEASALNAQARAELASGRPDRARALVLRSLELDARSSRSWLLLGATHERSGGRAEAERAYRQALALFPGDAEARRRLAALLARKGGAD